MKEGEGEKAMEMEGEDEQDIGGFGNNLPDPKTLFKMKRFRDVPPRTDTHRHKASPPLTDREKGATIQPAVDVPLQAAQ